MMTRTTFKAKLSEIDLLINMIQEYEFNLTQRQVNL